MIKAAPIPICKACNAFEISKQAFYKWRKKEYSNIIDKDILAVMQEIAAEFPKYGYRRVTHALRRDGVVVNHKKVRRIMKENNLLVRRKKSKPITTQSNHALQKYPNLVKDALLTGINQAWVSDITYISLFYEFVYLAVIMDLFSRRCIGWALSRNPDSQLTLDALNMAIAMRGNIEGCIHHSDHGVSMLHMFMWSGCMWQA